MTTYTEHEQRALDQASSRALDRLASAPAILVGSAVPRRRRPRPDFTTPPRPAPPIGVELASSTRVLGAMAGCFRRQADCPQIITRHGWRTWRWLCMAPGRP